MQSSASISALSLKDIEELEQKIDAFQAGQIPEDKFKAFRLTRGVYGQRQTGVHMFRTKIPYGKLTADQLVRLADVSDKYATGNLHLTTRQNIQFHYVKLQDSPSVWKDLAELGVTAREACGNTVRNLTASAQAGIDPEEPFDITPYAHAAFEYFLRNPICQDMGRKIKPAFSSSEKDSAFTYIHDFGFIPRLKVVDGEEVRGFKVVVGGGLGAQPIMAQTAYEFLPEDQIIPFMEAGLRIFDRYGERSKRFKARMKYLLKDIGLEKFMELIDEELKSIRSKSYVVNRDLVPIADFPDVLNEPEIDLSGDEAYQLWLKTNVFEQKQKGFYGVQIKVLKGDISSDTARALAPIVKTYAADDIRVTVNQGLLLRYVSPNALPHLYLALGEIGLSDSGFDTIGDVTACPGTDTCNLAVTDSTHIAEVLEGVFKKEYPHLIANSDIRIKISGCMNSCGQHVVAQIGLHGSSIKKKELVIPAMQILLGGGFGPDGKGTFAERVIKLPTKRIPDALRLLLNDFEENSTEGEYFNHYYQRIGKRYFYDLLKPLADIESLSGNDLFDWGQDHNYEQAIGIGECAGVSFDLIGSIIDDAGVQLSEAQRKLLIPDYTDAIYHAYNSLVIGAKALLLAKDVKCNTQMGILKDFETEYQATSQFQLDIPFKEWVLEMKQHAPEKAFAESYVERAAFFMEEVIKIRRDQLLNEGADKEVLNPYRA